MAAWVLVQKSEQKCTGLRGILDLRQYLKKSNLFVLIKVNCMAVHVQG